MANVILAGHLVIALCLIAVVLLQRSEGGALGIGGGGGFVSGRSAATALTKLTWGLGVAFVATSMLLTIIAVRGSRDATIVQPVSTSPGEVEILIPDLGESGDAPAVPPSQ